MYSPFASTRRHPLRRFVPALLICCFHLAGCSRAGDRNGVASSGPLTAPAQSLELERRRYIDASIEIGCLTRHETDPQRLAGRTLGVYRRYGFDDVMSFLALVEKVGQQKSVQQEIADGLKSCP